MGRTDSPLRDRVVFVQGAPRSGTTWLINTLATHRQIAGVEAESHLFSCGVDRLFDNFEGRDPSYRGLDSYLESREQLLDLARELCDGVLLAMRSLVSGGRESDFVVEKTPTVVGEASFELRRKRECYPDGWYLHIIRSGEAVTRSLQALPSMAGRSAAECRRVWQEAVETTRATLGDHPRYRELDYQQLRADPVEVSAELFRWLGIDAGEEARTTVARLSQERFSDRGVAQSLGATSLRALAARRTRQAVRSGRSTLARFRRAARNDRRADGSDLVFLLARALRERDEEALRSLTADSLELVVRSPEGDLLASGDAARAALLEIARKVFSRRHVAEWWASAGGGVSEWWTTVPGTPLWTLLFSGLGGDATRVDLALGLFTAGAQCARVTVFAAGSLGGRPLKALNRGA